MRTSSRGKEECGTHFKPHKGHILLAAAYDSDDKKDFYEFTLALDALKKSLTGEEKTVILDANSELAQILTGAG